MKKLEKIDVITEIENLQREEERYCKEYCKLNPADTERRERDKDLVLYAYMRILTKLSNYE